MASALPPYASASQNTWFYAFRIICGLIFFFLIFPVLVIIPLSFNAEDFFTFTPQFKLLIAGNHKPRLNAVDIVYPHLDCELSIELSLTFICFLWLTPLTLSDIKESTSFVSLYPLMIGYSNP